MSLQQSILATLAYHDIFNYPLTKEEVQKYLIGQKANLKSVDKILNRLTSDQKIKEKQGHYCLKNRTNLVSLRVQRARYSKVKFGRAQFFTNILKIIPTLKLVAISGALAMQNSDKDDDIDLVIISAQNTLWATRFFANLILFPFKRKPPQLQTTNYKLPTDNKACLNVFLDESDLKIEPRNLYLAHEICQMKPIFDRNQTYSQFIRANAWVKKYLPNWQPSSQFVVHLASPRLRQASSSQKSKPSTVNRQPSTIETLLKKFQLFYMKSKVSTERIGETQLFFHPANAEKWVIEEYQKRLKKLRIIGT